MNRAQQISIIDGEHLEMEKLIPYKVRADNDIEINLL
jgi:hypothetical protein